MHFHVISWHFFFRRFFPYDGKGKNSILTKLKISPQKRDILL